ncbi:GH36 C-terminal domain-containing protein, partial [Mesorhizobium japonicum]|uniref:GH36 C-terminal domain-containing protein n=1 Tax=Mesorhizobium japonicum TaxID=2066070 RepID=UPI003B5999E5
DGSAAVYVIAQLAAAPYEAIPAATLPGLDPARRYRVRPGLPIDPKAVFDRGAPAWIEAGSELELSGAALATIGIPLPFLLPEHAIVLDLEAIS